MSLAGWFHLYLSIPRMLLKHLDMCQGAAMDYLHKNLWESCARMARLVHHGSLPDQKDLTSHKP